MRFATGFVSLLVNEGRDDNIFIQYQTLLVHPILAGNTRKPLQESLLTLDQDLGLYDMYRKSGYVL